MHRWCQSTQDYQWPHFAHLLTLWLTPSFLHAQIDTWCRGRQTGGLSALRLQRCGPAVSRLIQSNLPLSQAGTPGCSPSSSRLEAQQTTQTSSTLHTAGREGSTLLVKSVLPILHKSSTTMWLCPPKACDCVGKYNRYNVVFLLCWKILCSTQHNCWTRSHYEHFWDFCDIWCFVICCSTPSSIVSNQLSQPKQKVPLLYQLLLVLLALL